MTQRILPTLLITAATAGALGVGHVARSSLDRPDPQPTASEAPLLDDNRPRIDVVFVLDTTGSMGGLLEGAKQKIWSIANRIVSGQPRPDVRFGLVGYRDRNDAYVTKITSLTRDMDAVHEELTLFRANGGGDGPEDVNAALASAIHSQPWDSAQNTLRLVFLVGDAPPHDDYDGPKSWELAARAREKGIIINTVQCGAMGGTANAWKRIAQVAGGAFDAISQDGGVEIASTPFDGELSELNRELAGTVISYGSKRARARSKAKMARRSSLDSSRGAAAAAYNAKAGRMNNEDLLTQLGDGKVKLDALDE
ncbi:MAG: vWA domain-containing protein, partial [Myxococcota bacterium]